jgi:hypothetical protein
MSIFYTVKERYAPTQTISWCVSQALAVLNEKGLTQVCVNFLNRNGYENTDKVTIKEASRIIKELIDDTLFHNGHYLGG